ncbi:hypothetical protein SKAU_G00060160 [Synaphobranchus kaupii]|uniref:Uncharacterized protein n=1 Tax=Synaphobranchus kaupii TaxID=118154 RepID=A0A9Q1J9I2_SYNKA|nr:hypothetical protein SKAU_G00060160 [Synaphobranchus kaupii]
MCSTIHKVYSGDSVQRRLGAPLVSSFLLHKELALAKGGKPLTQRQFREELCVLLSDCGRAAAPEEPTTSRED